MVIFDQSNLKQLTEKFEKIGENCVRTNLANKIYGEDKSRQAEAWLEKKGKEHRDLVQQKKLDLIEKANAVASQHNLISWIALVVSIIALVVSIFK